MFVNIYNVSDFRLTFFCPPLDPSFECLLNKCHDKANIEIAIKKKNCNFKYHLLILGENKLFCNYDIQASISCYMFK